MRVPLLLLCASCGRISFDARTDTGGAIDGAVTDTTVAPDGLGPSVIQSGLAFDLDPGNPASYSGAGTFVYDLSPFANDGFLMGGVGFTSQGAGSCLNFDGTEAQYLTLSTPSPAGWTFGREPRTLSGWAYANALRTGYNVYFSYGTGMDGQGNYLGTSIDGTQWNFGGFYINQLGGQTITGEWVQLTGVWDGTIAHLYINGALATEAAQPVWNATPGGDAKIGLDTNFTGEGWTGSVGRVLYYNRALSAAEVLHNFEVTRARYGL